MHTRSDKYLLFVISVKALLSFSPRNEGLNCTLIK